MFFYCLKKLGYFPTIVLRMVSVGSRHLARTQYRLTRNDGVGYPPHVMFFLRQARSIARDEFRALERLFGGFI